MQASFLNDPIYTEPNSSAVLLTFENSIVSRKTKKDEYLKNNFDPTILPEKQLLVYGIISSHPGLNTREIANLLSIKKNKCGKCYKIIKEKRNY